MNRKQLNEIKNSITACKLKLQTIQPHLGKDKPVLNENFNKILIEKAILRDKLLHKEMPVITKIIKKINGKKELICDYFK